MNLKEIELRYKMYLFSWLMSDIEMKIDNLPLSFKYWKNTIDKELNN